MRIRCGSMHSQRIFARRASDHRWNWRRSGPAFFLIPACAGMTYPQDRSTFLHAKMRRHEDKTIHAEARRTQRCGVGRASGLSILVEVKAKRCNARDTSASSTRTKLFFFRSFRSSGNPSRR
ncbi:hypothetical protein WR25_24488 [Diploscapter pachys]|uniref:Uncharacterized protein n=1 Tax=Diploscapter pachys TaxID=2018661 RepID=A0A2A2M398_9BILA|nr:hypothetical protein WR25_24488 [Diploscapter pachys]